MSKEKVSEDLFEETKMSFGEHIEELRVVFIRIIVGVGIATILGFMLSHHVVNFLQVPLKQAIEDFRIESAKTDIMKEEGRIPLTIEGAILEQRLLPKKLKIQPEEFAKTLKGSFPGLKLPEAKDYVNFATGQFDPANIKSIASSLANAREGTSLHSLWLMFNAQQQQAIVGFAESENCSDVDSQEMTRMFNGLLNQPEKFNLDDFSSITNLAKNQNLRDAIAILKKQEVSAEGSFAETEYETELRTVHQRLIQSAFPANLIGDLQLAELVVWEPIKVKSQSLGTQEPFMIWMKASLVTGLIISSPWIFYQVWLFVAAGLYPHEKKYVYLYIPFSLILFVGGAAFAFYVVFKYVLDFLFSFNAQMGIDPDPRINEYLGFVMMLPLGFGIAFQLPLVMLFVHRIGLITIETFLSKWRIAVLVICVVSMVCTPTDPISMILMAIPLLFLYFGGIALCKWMPKGRNPFTEAYDPA